MLVLKDLYAAVQGQSILKGVTLTLEAGKVHALMGPNGSGKSTLAAVLAGHPDYSVTQGTAFFYGHDLLVMAPEERAHAGLFLAFQHSIALPGITVANFLKEALLQTRKAQGLPPFNSLAFYKLLREKMKILGIQDDFIKRTVNEGFSGGEKKRNEILQMAVLAPRLAILDETDSGLDVDALRAVAQGLNSLHHPTSSMLVITHYPHLLAYLQLDRVHVLHEGRIVHTGGSDLVTKVAAEGYDWVK